ncbi:hypothetical protein TMES_06185 [Thalassospira mesophila]|uniref:Uncharacterized protein n=2 Tax=Thalassospira mesophila TaxID=1293891 RepID=A0A1Y2L4Y3_9PROT|nr:hypothetical protein TMES_06185 [Thalassospira mesophila]
MQMLTSILLLIVCLVCFATPGITSEQSDISNDAVQLRLTISRFDNDLQKHLKKALQTGPERIIQCQNHPDTLENCLSGPFRDLPKPPVTIRHDTSGPNSKPTPLVDLRAAEERFALYTDRVNTTNDLLSRAGLALFVPPRDLTPDIDDLRKRVLAVIENRHEDDLLFEKFVLIAGMLVVLAGIFGGLYLCLRRFKG